MLDKSPFVPDILFPVIENDLDSSEERRMQCALEQIKLMAIYQLVYTMFNALNIPWTAAQKNKMICGRRQLPHGLFRWDLEQLIGRRKYNLLWTKLLMIRMTPACLEMRKLEVDLEELMKFLKVMWGDYFRNRSTTAIEKLIRSAVDEFNYEDTLINQVKRNTLRLSDERTLTLAMSFVRYSQSKARDSFKSSALDRALRYITETRYESGYQKVVEQQNDIYYSNKKRQLEQAILQMSTRTEDEIRTARGTMDMYFTTIQSYREQIEQMRHKYEIAYAKWDGELSYKKLNINRYHDRMEFLKAQLEWYKDVASGRIPLREARPQSQPILLRNRHESSDISSLDDTQEVRWDKSIASVITMTSETKTNSSLRQSHESHRAHGDRERASKKRTTHVDLKKHHFIRRESGISLDAQPYLKRRRPGSIRASRSMRSTSIRSSSIRSSSVRSSSIRSMSTIRSSTAKYIAAINKDIQSVEWSKDSKKKSLSKTKAIQFKTPKKEKHN